MKPNRILATLLTVGSMFALMPATHAQAPVPAAPAADQDHQAHHPDGQVPDAKAQAAPMPMMDMQKMMADMKAAEAKLDALVVTMNSAKGSAKVDAVATTVTEMVSQQKAMHAGMMKMQGDMMMQMHSQMTKPMEGPK